MNMYSDIISLLKSKGVKITLPRKKVVEFITKKEGLFSAKELVHAIKDVDPASVYRTLSLLEELDIIDPILTLKGYQYYEIHGQDRDHHHHAVCLDCGVSKCVPCIVSASKVKNFTVSHHSFVATGYCGRCR